MKSIDIPRLFGRITPVLCAMVGLSATAVAQDFDDIYYNPAKDKAKEQAKTVKANNQAARQYNPATFTPTPDYTAAGSYDFNTGSTRDVDEYNRRTPVSSASQLADSTKNESDDFEYTRRIERFHNPDIVVESNDPDLIEYYYTTEPASPSVVNIYVNNDPWWGWNRPYCSTWAWSPFYYNYNTWWGPSWSLGWYDPWYSWSWGPSWGWGPSYGWGWSGPWHPGPRPPYPGGGWAGTWHPTPSSPGASRPHQWVGNGSTNTRPATSGGAIINNGSSVTRPGYTVGSLSGANASAARPGSTVRGRNVNASGNTYTPSATSTNTQRRNTSTNYNNNSNSYNSNRSSSSSFSTGSSSYRSSGGSSGGYRSSGGGSGTARGRR